MDTHFIRENISRIRKNMEPFPDAKLMAVVKTRTPEEIRFVLDCGITLLGENRVQELISHFEHLDSRAEIHFIGTLQKNKVKYIIDKVSMIESLDSISLAAEIDRQAAKHNLRMPVLIEVNISAEESKSGVMPEEVCEVAREIAKLPRLKLRGLMAIPEPAQDDESVRRPLRAMKALFDAHKTEFGWDTLSMGMSADMVQAVEEGATMVRVGSAIFGARHYPTKA